jgi:outer membrane receptor protein involved in Fe transport
VSFGVEGDFGKAQHWDVNIETGRTDNLVVQTGSSRISTYRAMIGSPNYGRQAIFDPNPFVVGFAESIATCTSGLPVIKDFPVSADCVTMMSPDLKNTNILSQSTFEANLVGDLAQMKAGALGYALGASYRTDEYKFEPDNLSQNQNFIDSIAGLFPTENSEGEFDVSELYGELLVPIVGKGKHIDHFNVELGGRYSNWSMEGVGGVGSYKALVDWGITSRYRLRGGFNQANRAPNLGELFQARTQIFGGVAAQFQDQCSQNNPSAPYSPHASHNAQQIAQTLSICRALMGPSGAATYYDSRPVALQPTGTGFFGGGNGTQNSFGNEQLAEEQADTFTLGVVMDILDGWQLSVDYYNIEIKHMIAVESPDTAYEDCLSIARNPSGSATAAGCVNIFRDPTNGNPSNIDLFYTNQGRAKVEGVDLQLNWTKMLAQGGFNLNSVMNVNMGSETQDKDGATTTDWAGTVGCALQIQCQGYDYRIFTTLSYFRGAWGLSLRHQFWPSIKDQACASPTIGTACATALGGVDESYSLFALSGDYRIGDKYTLRAGVENLFDTEPPMGNGNPNARPFPVPDTHVVGGFAAGNTYDPLGRRMFLSFTLDF